MSIHMQRQIEKVKRMILALAADVEHAVMQALQAVASRDAALAQKVIDSDSSIDHKEVEVEEECLHTLALEQPVAMDLRYVVSVLKMNNDLERIGDLAVNIGEQAIFLSRKPGFDLDPYLDGMPALVREMLELALDAMLEVDAVKAERVRQMDDRVDALHRRVYDQVQAALSDPQQSDPALLHVITISRNLERIADLAENIAEDVIYLARGEIFRHRSGQASTTP